LWPSGENFPLRGGAQPGRPGADLQGHRPPPWGCGCTSVANARALARSGSAAAASGRPGGKDNQRTTRCPGAPLPAPAPGGCAGRGLGRGLGWATANTPQWIGRKFLCLLKGSYAAAGRAWLAAAAWSERDGIGDGISPPTATVYHRWPLPAVEVHLLVVSWISKPGRLEGGASGPCATPTTVFDNLEELSASQWPTPSKPAQLPGLSGSE